ncbi:MAG: diacylglycerol kinase family protein [Porphyromonadaceae bacterium]|nr:MAG: diacylglycerol kinase family protein [Porphyromonadaceae bacterium]
MNSRKFSIPARIRSFKYAFRGLWWLIREEHNSWIYLAVFVILIPACILLRLSLIEWTLITMCTGLVYALELVNSAIERLADKISPERDPDIGKIKDLTAAAVLITAIAAAIVGLIILVPKFFMLIKP